LLTLFLALKKGRGFTTPHKHGEKKKERKSLLYSESQRAKIMLERQKAKGVETGKEEKDDEEAVVLPSP